MTKVVRIDPEAEEELSHAIDRYESEREGLGADFLDEVSIAMRSLSSDDTFVRVISVMHGHRRPAFWRRRL